MKKILILLISFAIIVSYGMTASAESITDSTGDIYHWHQTGGAYGWDTNVGDKPNIDITEISYTVSGDQVTITLDVVGTIVSSELVSYWAYLNTSDSNYYMAWNNGQGVGWGASTDEGSYQMDYTPEITASGGTITATYDVIGTFETGIEVWGWAAEYTTYGDMSNEWWADWAPESYSMYDEDDSSDTSGDDTDTDDSNQDSDNDTNGDGTDTTNENSESDDDGKDSSSGTPGFEFLALIAAFSAIIILVKKRK